MNTWVNSDCERYSSGGGVSCDGSPAKDCSVGIPTEAEGSSNETNAHSSSNDCAVGTSPDIKSPSIVWNEVIAGSKSCVVATPGNVDDPCSTCNDVNACCGAYLGNSCFPCNISDIRGTSC